MKQTRNGTKAPRGCKEKGCQGRIPTGKGLMAWYCQMLGYCRHCYRMNFPKRPRSELSVVERLLSWSERREMERAGFNTEIWSPGLRREMQDYWEAKERGEVR